MVLECHGSGQLNGQARNEGKDDEEGAVACSQ